MTAPKTARGIRINPHISETIIPGPAPVVQIQIAEISRDPNIQQRAGGVSSALVQEYSLTVGDWIDQAPLTVYQDLLNVWLADGFHRAEAALLAGLLSVPCVVHPGGYREALLCACGANATHGARRTAADRRRSIETLLNDPEWRLWSDRKIAAQVGVDHKTVSAVKRRMANWGISPVDSPRPNDADLPAVAEDRGELDESPVVTAAPGDTAAPAEALPWPWVPHGPLTPEPAPHQTTRTTVIGAPPDLPRPVSDADPTGPASAPVKRVSLPGRSGYTGANTRTAARLVRLASDLKSAMGSEQRTGVPVADALALLREIQSTAGRLAASLEKRLSEAAGWEGNT